MWTYVGIVTERIPTSLEYGDYRGLVELDAKTGEWLRNLTPDEVTGMQLGAPIWSVEYDDLRPVLED